MRIILLMLLSLLSLAANAQDIHLTILDQSSGRPIPDVLVKSPNDQKTTDLNGVVILVPSKKVNYVLSHVSYIASIYKTHDSLEDTVYLEPNSLALNEIVVQGFGSEKPLVDQPAAISHVSKKALARFDETSLVDAFNTVPGIRMEERAPNSYRISIRGSSLRAPFGVRNVKVYWNGIPYTAPDGTTALNLLDFSNVSQADIIKGPAGSIYGAGNGGVVRLKSELSEVQGGKASAEFMGGAFGTTRYRMGIQQPIKNGGISASYVRQKSDGFRDQSASDRKVFQWGSSWDTSNDNKLNFSLLYTDLYYELPGALTAEQMAEDRTQARPGSEEKNASIRQKALFTGLNYEYSLGQYWDAETSGYVTTSDFDDPFNTDYKKESQFGYGGRTRFAYKNNLSDKVTIEWISGAEYQFSKTAADNFGNVGGNADTLRFSDDLFVQQYFLFTQAELGLPGDFYLTAGVSQNNLTYDINRKVDMSTGLAYDRSRDFDPVWVPRVTLLKKLTADQSLRAAVSYGFSPPTIDEVRTNEGSINLDLEAEKGTNYELGYRGSFWNKRVNTDITLFYFKLDQTITTYTNPVGVVLFRNAGETDQKGVEFNINYDLIRQTTGFVNQLSLQHSYTGHFFEFKNYTQGEDDYSGNDLTGVAPNTVANTLDLNTSFGFYINLTHQFVDEVPLNDENSVYQEKYNLVSSRIGWKRLLSTHWELEVYGGIQNLFEEEYSRGNDLNPYGQRYYQPAPGRNGFAGLKLAFNY